MLNRPDAETTLLLLIRHGATDANLMRPYILQGRTLNGPLSQAGQQQVAKAGLFLSHFPIDHVFASPMLRAQQSAELIAEPHGLPVETVEDIAEVDVGEWESQSWEVIMENDLEHYKLFIDNPADTPYKGGESYRDVRNRVVPAFHQLAQENLGKMIAVVAHNVVNRALLADILQLDLRHAKEIKQNNACINVLRYHQEKLEVITLNGVFHLGEI